MDRRLAWWLCLFAMILPAGCIDPPLEEVDATGEPLTAMGAQAAVHHVPFNTSGSTMAGTCVDVLGARSCPLLGFGEGDFRRLDCGEGRAALLRGNLSWDDAGPVPLRFAISLVQSPPGTPWSHDHEARWVTTTSPFQIEADLTGHEGEGLALRFEAWHEAYVAGNGVHDRWQRDFQFAGTLGCAPP